METPTSPALTTDIGFGELAASGLPAFRAIFMSVCLHGIAVAGSVLIHFPAPPEKPRPPVAGATPTVVRIAERLYYVTDLNLPQDQPKTPPVRRQEAAEKKQPNSQNSGPADQAPLPLSAAAVKSNPGLRMFLPPDSIKNSDSGVTLLQPLLPSAPLPAVPQLPSFVIATAQLQPTKIPPKPFVVPGRQTPQPPDPKQPIPPPNLQLVHTDPVEAMLQPLRVLPTNWPAPLDAPPPTPVATVSPPTLPGDAVAILSLNDKVVPKTDQLIVPRGEVIGRTGDGGTSGTGVVAVNAAGTPAGSTSSVTPPANSAPPPPNTIPPPPNPTSATGAAPTPVSATPLPPVARPATAARPTPTGSSSNPTSGANPASVAPASGGASASSNGKGTPGGDSSKGGGSRSGSDVTILGNGTRSRAGLGAPQTAPAGPRIITRPANGTFDSVIVQSSPLEQFPEGKGLLSSRPIYTVYISLGTSKDWAFYFCLPALPAGAATTAQEEATPAPVQAPYPTRMLRPQIDVPSYFKYILVHGFINTEGRFENLKVVKSIRPEMDQALLAALAGWEFRAATKDGANTTVEFLLSIPVSGL